MVESELNILIVMPMGDEHKLEIMKAATGGNFIFAKESEVSDATLGDMDIIIGNLPVERLKVAKNLKWLQLNSAGADLYVKEGKLPNNAILTNATGAYGLAISEHMIGMLLELIKKLNLYRDNQMKGLWKDEGEVKSIYGSTVLIVGLGDIGGEFARKIKALGGYTIGIRRSNDIKPEYLDEIYLMDKLEEVLSRADVVALSLPSTKDTFKLFSKEKLCKMKKGSVLLNVGRGNVLDTEALCDVVEDGYLSGVALDVTDPEPLPVDHRLWKYKNVIITPHISGDYHLKETHNRIVHIAAKNLKSFVAGKELENVVDFKTGYRTLKK